MVPNCSLSMCPFVYRLDHSYNSSKSFFVWSRVLSPNSQLAKVRRTNDCGVFSYKWDSYVVFLLSRAQGTLQRWGEKILRARGWGRVWRNVFWTWHDHWTPEHKELWLPVQEQTGHPSSTEMGEVYEPTPAAEELWQLVVGEFVFFRGVVPGKPTMLLWMAPHPCVCEQQLLDSVL